jgi:hypothetical protein
MDESARFSAPVSIPRPRRSRLIEALSPKLVRGRNFFGWCAFDKRIGLDLAPAALHMPPAFA